MSEDNPLQNVNLDAVTVPLAPAGFADSVLARFATTEAAIAVAKRRRVRRIVGISAMAFTAAAAALALVILWPGPSRTGTYVADAPRRLEIGGITVELDRGATIAWMLDRDRVRVDQRGGATWTVPADHDLRIEVAGVGAVAATNATLRVEARMNLLDGNRIGATVATAALVTALTATVIHGRAELESATPGKPVVLEVGHTASVAPATTISMTVPNDAVPVEVELAFSGDVKWVQDELPSVEDAIDHVGLPPGSKIGAVGYTRGNVTVMETLPREARFSDIWPKLVERFDNDPAGDLKKAAKTGFARLTFSKAPRRVLVIVGDGNDADREGARLALAELQNRARAAGIEIRAVLAPGGAKIVSTVEQAGITTVDASKVDLTHALADAMGGTVLAPPKAVMVLIEEDPKWLNRDIVAAIAAGLAKAELPRDSRIGAVAFTDFARVVVPLEPTTSFTGSQLDLRGGQTFKVTNVEPAFSLAAQQLAKAPERDKLIVVIGDASSYDEVVLVLNDVPGKYRHDGIQTRAIHYGRVSAGSPEWLDPKAQEIVGPNNPAKLQALTAAVVAAVR